MAAASPAVFAAAQLQTRQFARAKPWDEHHTPEDWNRKREDLNRAADDARESYGAFTRARRDFIEHWGKKPFVYSVVGGNVLAAGAILLGDYTPLIQVPFLLYAYAGYKDMNATHRTARRNFPVLIWFRYILESFRPEMRQYFLESDLDQTPLSRAQRSLVYQRAKKRGETQAFGTLHNVYDPHYEWLAHSNLGAKHLEPDVCRIKIGDDAINYSASIFNISAMSYGALSHRAVKALNWGAKMGGFYHNTGEGGFSPHHQFAKADVVWNVGTGYFGCRDFETGKFSEDKFLETFEKSEGCIRMIEVKLSQGAKPGHGGLAPAEKVSKEVSEIRGIPMGKDCLSPPTHSAFSGPDGLVAFCGKLRNLVRRPVGFKTCVGDPVELASIVKAIQKQHAAGHRCVDFITIDGGEGGTGAAPVEFMNRVGMPGVDALMLADDLLRGAGIRDDVKIINSGKITDGFGVARALALGADACNSARGMMFALGCIQALKCNTNKCPTGITTNEESLVAGLNVDFKALRVRNYQEGTVRAAAELIGAAGLDHPEQLTRRHIMKRLDARGGYAATYDELHPTVESGSLLRGEGPRRLQSCWDQAA